MLKLELGEEVANLKCDCCGTAIQSVNGFIYKNDWAYAVYFATLQTGHDEIQAGLTISVGKWWDDTALSEREWIYLVVWPSKTGSGFEVRVEEPGESRHYGSDNPSLGKALTIKDARLRSTLDDFFDVAGFAIDNDPALLSYIQGKSVNIAGRVCKHA